MMHDERQSRVFLINTPYFFTIKALDTFGLDDHFPDVSFESSIDLINLLLPVTFI